MVKFVSAVVLAGLVPFVAGLFIPDYVTTAASRFSPLHDSEYEAPIHTASNAKVIDDHYIVVFHPHVKDEEIENHHVLLQTMLLPPSTTSAHGGQQPLGWHNPLIDLFGMVKHTYNISNKLKGYSGLFSRSAIDMLRKDPRVAYIEHDQEVSIYETEKNAPWGLARLSHRESLGLPTFNKYLYDVRGGEGVTGT
jgi:cerevisin